MDDGTLQGVADVRDESDRDGMRVVVELKRGADAGAVQARLGATRPEHPWLPTGFFFGCPQATCSTAQSSGLWAVQSICGWSVDGEGSPVRVPIYPPRGLRSFCDCLELQDRHSTCKVSQIPSGRAEIRS